MSNLSVDFHTHILHRVDDGSASLTETLAMLGREYEMGIKTVVATPHFYADVNSPESFFAKREQALADIEKAAADGDLKLPKIVLGAEVLYFDGLESWDILPELAIEGTEYILIEMPRAPFSNRHLESLASFKSRTGYTPIIAHLDRYIKPFKTYNLPEILSEMDVLVQINASSLLSFPESAVSLKLLKSDMAHLLGSDCHNLTTRKPNMDLAQAVILKKLGQEKINQLIEFENAIFGN